MKVLFLCTMLLAGCASTSVSEFRAPDGSVAKSVKCTSDAAKCFAAASKSCLGEGTYRVVSSDSHAGGLLADVLPGPVTWYAMNFVCGASDGKMPEFKFVGQQYVPPSPPPSPIVVKQQPRTTNCTKIGNTTNCTTY